MTTMAELNLTCINIFVEGINVIAPDKTEQEVECTCWNFLSHEIIRC